MPWKSRWTDDWFLKRVADQRNRARIQDNQILISAYDEILSQTFSYNCLMISELPVPEKSPLTFGGKARSNVVIAIFLLTVIINAFARLMIVATTGKGSKRP